MDDVVMEEKMKVGKTKIEISLLTERFGCPHSLASVLNSLNFHPISKKGNLTVQPQGAGGQCRSSTETSSSMTTKAPPPDCFARLG